MKKANPTKRRMLNVRMTPELRTRIEIFRDRMERATGVRVTLSSVYEKLLDEGLKSAAALAVTEER